MLFFSSLLMLFFVWPLKHLPLWKQFPLSYMQQTVFCLKILKCILKCFFLSFCKIWKSKKCSGSDVKRSLWKFQADVTILTHFFNIQIESAPHKKVQLSSKTIIKLLCEYSLLSSLSHKPWIKFNNVCLANSTSRFSLSSFLSLATKVYWRQAMI